MLPRHLHDLYQVQGLPVRLLCDLPAATESIGDDDCGKACAADRALASISLHFASSTVTSVPSLPTNERARLNRPSCPGIN